jgi:FkbM family methyltransferase
MKKLNIIDVGCSHFLDKEWKKNIKKINFFLGFDPFGESKTEYVNKNFPENVIYKNAVFDKEEDRDFYICNKLQCSSLFLPNEKVVKEYTKKDKNNSRKYHRMDVKKVVSVKCIRLDSVISELDKNFDFIKVDTQGAEIEVLKSLGKYLTSQIVGAKLELSFQSLYKGISLYGKVDKFMKNNGFIQVKNLEKNKFWGNFLYIREDRNKKKQIKLIKKIYGI